MALVPSGGNALALVQQQESRPQISEAERAQRVADAEKLEDKLNHIQESVPTRIFNVSGSTAGAGSGDFHQYRMARRREQSRLARIEKMAEEEQERGDFERQRDKRAAECEERSAKRRAKRQKKKAKKRAKGASEPGDGAPPSAGDGDSEPEQADLD
eukprot:jgi/Tetstr1/431878/TSEL_021368.t1